MKEWHTYKELTHLQIISRILLIVERQKESREMHHLLITDNLSNLFDVTVKMAHCHPEDIVYTHESRIVFRPRGESYQSKDK